MKKVVIWGTGMFADLAYLYMTEDSDYEICGFVVDADSKEVEIFHNLPVVSRDKIKEVFPPDQYAMFIPMSQKENGNLRKNKYLDLKAEGYSFATYIHSKARVFSHTKIGENCFILEDNIIQYHASIGNNVMMWSGNHIGHHSVVGDHGFLTSKVVVAGRVTIGEKCYMGIQSAVGDGITIAENNIIGARALIMRNTKPSQAFVENPTKLFPLPSEKINLN